MWDESKLSVVESLKGGYSLSVKFLTIRGKHCLVTNVYGPCDYKERKFLWPELLSIQLL